ncbi:6-phosphogluconolactonase [Sporothrix schenckii 1099-18]|uniref:6-phosphogluconolactonase n=2 Tax=Sporothrix schenckii TaxID=29908 RepID=U7PPD8_SPOS1|nr:6-phosphogluconolactonase [Sporothrix schenckii 1099-18]ERS97488.1 hypothetical protein HMPREF1624_05656 [Sporothrix schenckii ATCC 58251]KJR81996.1 6-phosphogluconolactonase [Sporothrix schenckii 1099-18]
MWSSLFAWAAATGNLALRHLSLRQDADAATTSTEPVLLIGGGPSGTIAAATFDGTTFDIIANNTLPGTSPSWLLYKDPNLVYAVDENSNSTRLFQFDATTNAFDLLHEEQGSQGVVYLSFNLDATRMVGAAYGAGQVDVWDVSAGAGGLTLLKQIASDDPLGPNAARQEAPHPHQALLDPSGRFFVVNDLGTDTLLVLDTRDDAFAVVNRVRVPDAGCGPRHAAFFPATGADVPTNYLVVCELLSLVEVFALNITDDGDGGNLTFQHLQSISTFDPLQPPANASTATAAEIVVSADNQHAYVSNRNTGNATDSVAHFGLTGAIGATSGDALVLTFVETISSGGLQPRMVSLSTTDGSEALLFAANQDGAAGLLAIARDSTSGNLTADAASAPSVPLSVFGPAGNGPQYVQQVPIVLTS